MILAGLEFTCSMGELGKFDEYRDDEEGEIPPDPKGAIDYAFEGSYDKAFIANLSAHQLKQKPLVAALVKKGFKKVGTYRGNDGMVHVFLKGVRLSR